MRYGHVYESGAEEVGWFIVIDLVTYYNNVCCVTDFKGVAYFSDF